MASASGGDFAIDRNDRLPQWDADATNKLPSADETIKDLVPPHPDVIEWLLSYPVDADMDD
jgi:hypothetical protein